MRKLIVTNIISLDGYYLAPGGAVMALPLHQGSTATTPSGCAPPTPSCLAASRTRGSRASPDRSRDLSG